VAGNKSVPLRVLVLADPDRLSLVAPVLCELGHVLSCEDVVPGAEARVQQSGADLAIVALGSTSPPMLDFVERVSAEATFPVIACLAEADESFICKAAEAGVLTCVVGNSADAWRDVIEIALRPYAGYHQLLASLRRRAVIERAKGVLMERHGAREESAFELIRTEARRTNRRAVDVAQALLDGQQLLPNTGRRPAVPDHVR
jgi:AmiR/NasT family two-component response regulator